MDDDPSTDTPDALFPNNWVSFHSDGRVVSTPCSRPTADKNVEDILHDTVHTHGFAMEEIVDFTEFESHDAFLEGTGSMVLDRIHGKAYAALSPRTDRDAFEHWCEAMDLEGVVFEAFQSVGDARKAIYHTNVMMAIGTGWAGVFGLRGPSRGQETTRRDLVGGRVHRCAAHRKPNQPLRRQHARSPNHPRRDLDCHESSGF